MLGSPVIVKAAPLGPVASVADTRRRRPEIQIVSVKPQDLQNDALSMTHGERRRRAHERQR